MFKTGYITVMVSNLDRAVQFYTETLGLKLDYEVKGHWAQVGLPGVTIGLHPAGEHGPRPGRSESLSIGFEVDDLTAAMERLCDRGVSFADVLEEKATRLAYFGDPDGTPLYLVQVNHERPS